MIEHVQKFFSRFETRATILLRPQNDQTFETSPKTYSLQGQLIDIAFQCAGPAQSDFSRALRTFPDIYVVSYPKYYEDVFLLYPLLGHELGHVAFETREYYRVGTKRASELLSREFTEEALHTSALTLAVDWAQELYCDYVGLRLYGDAYIYALYLMLLPYRRAFEMPEFEEYSRTSHHALHAAISLLRSGPKGSAGSAGDTTVWSSRRGPTSPEHPEDQLFRDYPSPGQRLRFLFEQSANPTYPRNAPNFSIWARKLRDEYKTFEENFRSPIYEDVLKVARLIAIELGEQTLGKRAKLPRRNQYSRQLSSLIGRLHERIPPCEWSPSGSTLEPSDWACTIHAAWAYFVENSMGPDPKPAEWLSPWLEFVYDSLDMLSFYETFESASKSMSTRR